MHVNVKKLTFAGALLAVTEVCIALGSVIETNTLFLLAAASFFVGILIREYGLKSGAGFLVAGILLGILLSPNKLYVIFYALMGIYILGIEWIWYRLGKATERFRSKKIFWIMKYLLFNLLYIPGLFSFRVIAKGGSFSLALFWIVGQFALLVYDKAYEYVMGQIWEKNRHKFGF